MSSIEYTASPASKLDFILLHISNYVNMQSGKKNGSGGAIIDVRMCYAHFDHNYFKLDSYQEMAFYMDTLIKMGRINKTDNEMFDRQDNQGNKVRFPAHISLTFQGLERCYEIENQGSQSTHCFVAMVFDTNKEKRLNAISQACRKNGFDAMDVESYHVKDNQTIDAKIIAAIKSARFCIADFTGLNQGAYFEAGYAMGRNMKVIFICERKDFIENRKHFDVNHYPFVCYDDFEDLAAKLETEIKAYISA